MENKNQPQEIVQIHAETLRLAAKKCEDRLFKTYEKLTADEIEGLCDKMSKYIGTIEYLAHIRAQKIKQSESEKKIIPAEGLRIIKK